jgi:AcrR family transcriptional regulator
MSRKPKAEPAESAKSAEPSPPVVSRSDDLVQRAIDAAAVCVARLGLQKTSMDDIAAESGISRATLYRRLGSRESILNALLQLQARPFVAESIRVSAGARSLAERLEIGTVFGVMETARNPTLNQLFDQGVSRASLDFVRPVFRQLMDATLLGTLQAAQASGELRPGLDSEEVIEWLLTNFLLLVAQSPWQKEPLLRRIRQYILPVLIPDAEPRPASASLTPAESLDQQLRTLDRRVAEVQQTLGLLRLDMTDPRVPLRARQQAAD